MHKTKTGRWQPDSPARAARAEPEPDPALAAYVMSCQWAKEITPMPDWWPLMSFEAAVGRWHMSRDDAS